MTEIGCKCYIYIKFNCSCDVLNYILQNVYLNFFSFSFFHYSFGSLDQENVMSSFNFQTFQFSKFNAFVIHWKCVRYIQQTVSQAFMAYGPTWLTKNPTLIKHQNTYFQSKAKYK